jgi:hypothetical protein
LKEWKCTLDYFCAVNGMKTNMGKSIVLFSEMGEEAKGQLIEFLPFSCISIDEGVKYLGFKIKPNSYYFDDWACLIKK